MASTHESHTRPIDWLPLDQQLGARGAGSDGLPGFDSEFADIVDYIIKITHRIWEQKNPGLCYDYYSDPCPLYTLGGYSESVESVVNNTLRMMSAFPDRLLLGENVVWSAEADGSYYSSHRITSAMTNTGRSELGPATRKPAWVMTLADCICRNNRIEREWLVRDYSFLARQLGYSPLEIARRNAANEPDSRFQQWWADEWQRVQGTGQGEKRGWSDATTPEEQACAWVQSLLARRDLGAVQQIYHPNARVQWPGGRVPLGLRGICGMLVDWLAQFRDSHAACDHIAVLRRDDNTLDIAVRWMLSGHFQAHNGEDLARCTGTPTLVLAVSHLRIRRDQVIADWTVFDEIALYANLLRMSSSS